MSAAALSLARMTPDDRLWSCLADETADALLALPGDGLLELLVRDVALTVTWLLPERLLLELSGAPPACRAALRARGWTGRSARHASAGAAGRAAAASEAAHEAVGVLRHVLQADPADVELWRPRVDPPEVVPVLLVEPGAPW